MATFVDTSSEEEQITTLVLYVSNLKKKKDPEGESSTQFSTECTRLLQESRTKEVILNLIGETDTIFSDTNEKVSSIFTPNSSPAITPLEHHLSLTLLLTTADNTSSNIYYTEIEACLSIISALIRKLEPEFVTGAQKLREAVASNTDPSARPSLRLKVLTNIYHAFDQNSLSRYETFMTLAKYAHESNNAELIIPKFKQIDKWLSDWGTNVDQSRRLFMLIRKILRDNHRSAQAHKFIVKNLQTYHGDDATSPEVIAQAVEAVLEAITFEDLFQCDHLLSIASVQALEKDAKYGNLYKLLNIFASDKLDAFQAFVKEHPGYLESLSINYDQSIYKMRLLSLASLGTETREIPYSLITSTLQISLEEVEGWVIDAVSAKLLEAKMNQLKQTVAVGFCVQRVFTQEQWGSLATLLKKWQTSVQQLLTTVNQIKAVQV